MTTLMPRPMTNFWRYYCQQLDRRPLLTRSLTGLIGGVLGDALAQFSERTASHRRTPVRPRASHHPHPVAATGQTMVDRHDNLVYDSAYCPEEETPEEPYDWVRTLRLAVWGALVNAPLGYKWFQLLDARVYPGNPTCTQAVFAKMLLDQLIMAPFGTALFFAGMKTMEGTPQLVVPTLKEKYPTALSANYLLWPLAHLVNFKFVPSSQRILYVNAVAVAWTAMLSHIVEGGHHEGGGDHGPAAHAKAA